MPTAALSEDDRLARLAERLATSRRAREAEIEARFASQRADQEAARRAIQQKMEDKHARIDEVRQIGGTGKLGTGKLSTGKPGTSPLVKPGTGPLAARPEAPPALEVAPSAELGPPAPAPPPARKTPARFKPVPRPRKGKKSPYASQPPEDVLALARTRMTEGDHDGAAEALSYLVASNQLLDDIIRELEVFTASNPDALALLQVLGDAYMKGNRLQKALDVYRMALGQL